MKSCKEDFYSGFGQNFLGEKNYLVMPMKTYKEVINDIPHNVGVLCPVPLFKDDYDEFVDVTEFDGDISNWQLRTIKYAHIRQRERSIIELLFCMLRSGKG